MRLGKTTIAHFSSQLVISVSGFAATFAIAFLLSADGLGRYAVIVALGYFWLTIPADAMTTAIAKRMSEGEAPGRFFVAGAGLNLFLGIGVATVVYLVGGILQRRIPVPGSEFVLVVSRFNTELALLVVSTVGFKSVLSGLNGQRKVAAQGAVQATERFVRTSLQVGVMLLGFGVSELVLTQVVSLSVVGLGGLALFDVRYRLPGRRHVTSLVAFARYAWLGSLRSRVFGWMDTLVLSFFVGPGLIGIYEAAWGLASLLGTISASIQQTLFPEFSNLEKREKLERVHHLLNEGLVFSGVFVIPGLVGVAIIGDRVLQFYRPSFGQGYLILIILVGAYVFQVYGSQFVGVLNAVDLPDVAFRINAVFIVLSLVLNVALVASFGWHGAASATLFSSLAWMGLSYVALRDSIGAPTVPVAELGFEVLASGLMALVVVPLTPWVPASRAGTVTLVAVGAVSYVAALLVLSRRIREKMLSLLPRRTTVNSG